MTLETGVKALAEAVAVDVKALGEGKVDKVAGYSLVDDDEIAKLLTVEHDAQKNTVSRVAGKQGDVLLDKEDVGLSAVDNTADTDKPVSTAVADALADKVDAEVGKGLIEPAPEDGKQYARKNGEWVEVTSGGGGTGGVEEAPVDGKQYARKDGAWIEVDKPQTIETVTANKTLNSTDNNKILLISTDGVTIALPTATPSFTVDIVKMDENFVTLVQTSSTDKFREDTTTITVVKDVTIFRSGVEGKEYVAVGAYEV